ncbi:helix-turn-helix domain-containing protein [Sphingopyxis sp. JAI108]|uniref:AlbA family DNA-binding domain-containing protein n=1 Tax=Sphingopyxis sp. JAI108 TaxID=2723060 RepID=UPI0015CD16A6|nr:hypothetical protein [Sphingopyxis sp. JAI108]NYF33679.1 hypothetical protein [Sphingopyxis sp. JAI108]
MANEKTDRLTEALAEPRENLDTEIKNWLDLKSNEDDKANFAKAALAIANHGGGRIIFGLTETPEGMVPAPDRPATLDGYRPDLLNGIIHKYADPAFHCDVHMRPGPGGEIYPVVVIPGGHRVPVRSKRSGPHGQIVKDNSIYIRRPGPSSEVPQNSGDWDLLLGRCLSHRRDEMFDQIRSLITGAVPPAELPSAPDRLESWVAASLERWTTLAATLPEDAPERCPHGFMWYAFELGGDIRSLSASQFAEVLRSAEVNFSGWPPFWYPTRRGIAPYPLDGMVECWIGGDTEDGFGNHGSGNADFWRVSPDGLAFFLRGYREDDLAGGKNMPTEPGSWIEVEWPTAITAEILLYVKSLAERLIEGPASVRLRAGYTGLNGRTLQSITGRYLHPRISRQDTIDLESSFATEALEHNLAEIVHPFVAPLYAIFDFFELPMSVVTDVIGKLRQRSY